MMVTVVVDVKAEVVMVVPLYYLGNGNSSSGVCYSSSSGNGSTV